MHSSRPLGTTKKGRRGLVAALLGGKMAPPGFGDSQLLLTVFASIIIVTILILEEM